MNLFRILLSLFSSQFEFLLNFFHRRLIKPNEAFYLCRNSHELNDIHFLCFYMTQWYFVIIL